MKQEDISQDDIILGEFVGIKFRAVSGYNGNSALVSSIEFDTYSECNRHCLEHPSHNYIACPDLMGYNFKFKTSWDALMRVVAKISHTQPMNQAWYDTASHLLHGRIDVVYNNALSFVKWHNSIKPVPQCSHS